METITPIAFMRVNDVLCLWMESEAAWAHLDQSMAEPRVLLSAAIAVTAPGSMLAPDVIVVPFAAANLPECLPSNQLVGCHPSLRDRSVREWDGPTTRDEEEALH